MKKISTKKYFALGTLTTLVSTLLLALIGSNGLVVSEKMRDFYIPIFKAINTSGNVFSQNAVVTSLSLTDRDLLFHETAIVNLLFLLLPALMAIIISFALKMLVAITGTFLLNKELMGEKAEDTRFIALILGVALGLIPVDPYYYLAFASLPLILFLILRLRRKASFWVFISLLFYPVLSEFFHLGLYIVLGIFVFAIVNIFINKKFQIKLFIGGLLLLIGYLATQYRAIRLIVNENSKWWTNILSVWKGKDNICEEITLLVLAIAVIVIVIAGLRYAKNVNNDNASQNALKISIGIAAVFLLVPFSGNMFTNWIFADEDIRLNNYYQEDFFKEVKEKINYLDQWGTSYGMPKSLLIYNDFRVIDSDTVLDTIYSEYSNSTIGSVLNYDADTTKDTLPLVDADKYKDLYGRLLFASKPMDEAKENGWILLDSMSGDKENNSLYVYQTASRYKYYSRSNIPYPERSDFSYDINDYESIRQELLSLAEEANSYRESHTEMSDSEIVAALSADRCDYLYNALKEEIDKIETVYWLSQIEYDKNIYDEELDEKISECYSDLIDASENYSITIRELIKSPYKEIMSAYFDPWMMESLSNYEEMTDEEKDISIRLNSLGREYRSASMDEYYFEKDGVVWTFESYNTQAGSLSVEDRVEIYEGLYKEKGKVIGEIYREVIQLENRLAQIDGYDNYIDMAYADFYYRDYSAEEVKNIFEDIKKSLQYRAEIDELNANIEAFDIGFINEDDTATYEMLYPYIKDIDYELGDSLRYLLDNKLYDLKISDTKPNTGYSIGLKSFNDAYIFNNPTGYASDLYTYVHEFGHYNNYFYVHDKDLQEMSNQDLAEIQSQGLEVIMAGKYNQIFDKDMGLYLEVDDISTLIDTLGNAAVITEFEFYAFNHPDATAEELSSKMLEIYNEYGYDYGEYLKGFYFWIDITHLYEAPLYYVSYLTSALAALEFYALSEENYDLAVEKYMEISTLDSSMKYRRACQFAGLSDYFEEGVVQNLYRRVCDILKQKVAQN